MVPPARTPLRAHRLRPLNLPRQVVVELDDHGFPRAVVAAPDLEVRTAQRSDHYQENRTVESIGEIWRVDDEWWRQALHRRYVEVVLEGGKHTILYQDEITGEWFEQTP